MNDSITMLVSVVGVLFLLGLILVRALILNHREGKRQKERERQLAEQRKKMEDEVMRKVKGIKDRSDAERIVAAVQRDPERVARTVKIVIKKK